MGSITHFKKELLDGYDCFVETGTSYGGGTNYLAGLCKEGFTIDVVDNWKNKKDNVTFILGDSVDHIEILCKDIESNCIFWLDAHYGDKGTNLPLITELSIIADNRQDKEDLILIDDLRIYNEGSYQSGNLPQGYEPGGVDLVAYVQELFPDREVIVDCADEGYLIVKNK